MTAQTQKWREAHSEIGIDDAPLETMAPFPSLYANDFIAMVEARGDDHQIVDFVRGIHREMVWVYGNWAKAQRDGDAARLLTDLLNNATGSEFDLTRKFLTDYAKANNIRVDSTPDSEPAWFAGMRDVKEAAE